MIIFPSRGLQIRIDVDAFLGPPGCRQDHRRPSKRIGEVGGARRRVHSIQRFDHAFMFARQLADQRM
jgi:hypothetical protein